MRFKINDKEVQVELTETHDGVGLMVDGWYVVGITPDGRVRLDMLRADNPVQEYIQTEPYTGVLASKDDTVPQTVTELEYHHTN